MCIRIVAITRARVIIIILMLLISSAVCAQNQTKCAPLNLTACLQPLTLKERKKRFAGRAEITDFFAGIVRDVVDINYQLLSLDSFAIIAGLMPPFITARMVDEPLQNCFYRRCCHKNVHQLPDWCRSLATYIIGIPAIYFGLEGFLSSNPELRAMGQLLLVGLPFVVFGKDLLKHSRFNCGLRPWNQYFSCHRRSGGGFPSGHVAEATYVAALYGLRFGPRYAIPLGAGALFVAVSFVNCNRHYLSQVVAGAGLGLLYAVAANKVVDNRLEEYAEWQCGFGMSDKASPIFKLSCKF